MRSKRGFYSWKNFNLSSTTFFLFSFFFFSTPALHFFLFFFSLLPVRRCAHFSSSLSYLLQIVNKSRHISFNALDFSTFFLFFFLFFSFLVQQVLQFGASSLFFCSFSSFLQVCNKSLHVYNKSLHLNFLPSMQYLFRLLLFLLKH
jgi:hypothetical protein